MRTAASGTKTRRCLGAGVIVLVLAACSPSQPADGQDNTTAMAAPAAASSVAPPASAASVAAPAQALSEDAVVELVNAAIEKHKLTDVPEQCLSYSVEDNGGKVIDIDVHEKHDDTCGGDPGVAPRLFSFKLDRASHQLSTDALDQADGDFEPID